MDTSALKKFAQSARTQLMQAVKARLALVLAPGSAARREHPGAVIMLEGLIRERGEGQVVEQVAYTWFNRFTALRFMDVNGYTEIGVLSPAKGQSRPEVLAEAMAGQIDEAVPEEVRVQVAALLDGRAPSADPQGEGYRLLLVAACNQWHARMPFLFEEIEDYTELLMPEDLLSPDSLPVQMRAVMSAEACQDVEIIGWLYQFYISEKKDEVFAALKKNIKITPQNIPAATQLFTPHWIVRYLVENSLGRLWLLNRPNSRLAEKMDYYIKPEQPEADFIGISSPEEIRICDPACGSGHMLTYAFDLLHAIYEEEGYAPADIPALILTHNLHGIEIDERAGALAAFALAMKAAQCLGRRRFLRMRTQPKICVLENVSFAEAELREYFNEVGRDLFTAELRTALGQFVDAKNCGSLIVLEIKDILQSIQTINAKPVDNSLFVRDVHKRVLIVLRMSEFLSGKYHIVVANPPYMGARGMNPPLLTFAKSHYPDSSSDLYAMFMERALEFCQSEGFIAIINMQSWMFLSSFEALRAKLFDCAMLMTMAHIGERGFDAIGGAVVSTTAFTMRKASAPDAKGTFIRLVAGGNETEKSAMLRNAISNLRSSERFSCSAKDLAEIPGIPCAYWVSSEVRSAFNVGQPLGSLSAPRKGNTTTNNSRFLRFWAEVSVSKTSFDEISDEKFTSGKIKWCPYNKGGGYRKWYGFNDFLVNWHFGGAEIKAIPHSVVANEKYFFLPGWTWSTVSSGKFSVRKFGSGFIFDNGGCCVFGEEKTLDSLGPFMNSVVFVALFSEINPTLNFQSGDVAKVPILQGMLTCSARNGYAICKSDWDSYETSWDFSGFPLLSPDHRASTLERTYASLRAHWRGMTDELRNIEEENNRTFINLYGLQSELTPGVPLEELTLTSNPSYRYGCKISPAEQERRLCADSMAEFLHYAVGCMFGRYALEVPGLILANQSDGIEQYLVKVASPSFPPTPHNVIPVLDDPWFDDDVTERFRAFLRLSLGEANYRENVAFIEEALGNDIRKFFTKEFFEYHVRRFKKRPIYWMFSSPKGSFNALIYLHRYRPETVSVLLNDYLREFIAKLQGERVRLEKQANDPAVSQGQRTKALKESAAVAKQIDEITEWEREVIFPLAQKKIDIDLDDGVKANYPKFGAALKPIKGLEAADD